MNVQEIKNNPAREILKFSIPAIISMVLTAFITVADGFFMGNYVGKEGIAAVNLGLPVVYLYLGVGLMVSIGGVAMAGMALGSGDRSACKQIFRHGPHRIQIAAGKGQLIVCLLVRACISGSPCIYVFR